MDAWERVKKRVRGRNKTGPKTAAYLNDYTIVGVESASDAVVVVMQAAHALHYKYMQEKDYCTDVEWALTIEFGQKCQVRLLAPGQPVPAPLAYSSNGRSANTAMPVAPQQSAHRERPASKPPAPAKPVEKVEPPELAHDPTPAAVHSPAKDDPSLIAKKNMVREDTRIASPNASPQPSLDAIRQKVSSDPVVQEAIRTFTAKIIDIRPK